MESKIRVLLSTMGPLHLIKSAEFLNDYVDIKVLQGWIPQGWNRWFLKQVSRIVGRDLEKSFTKRTPSKLEGRNHGLFLPEAYNNFARIIVKTPSLRNRMVGQSLRLFGFLSRFYIHDIDILHVRSGSGCSAIGYAKKHGIKVIVDNSCAHPDFYMKQEIEELGKHGLKQRGAYNPILWQTVLNDCKKADVLMVNSLFVKKTFVEHGFDSNRIAVAYLGVRSDFFHLKNDYNQLGAFKVLFTGRFAIMKGAEYMLRAFKKMDEMNFKYEFIVVGDYSDAKLLIDKMPIKNLNLVGHVPQDELKQYLSVSDAYLIPSLSEGCASSGMEAMAAGLPVIATEESGLPIIDNENGLIIPTRNDDAIVEKLLLLSRDKSLRKRIGSSAADLIGREYTWEKYAEKVTEIYRNC